MRLGGIERELAALSDRVAKLEQMAASGAWSPVAMASAHGGVTPRAAEDRSARIITHIGQMLIALGVGYLLRALTEAELVSHVAGVWIGLVYALGWIGLSLAGAHRGDRLAAWFAAAVAPILAFPLIVEAAIRFELWSSSEAFLVLGAVTAALLVTSVWQGRQSIAWLATLGAAGTAAAIMVGSRGYVAAAIFYIALGMTTLWLGYLREWTLLRWPAALAANVVVVALVMRALTPDAQQSAYAAMAVLLLLLLAYPTSIMVRTIVLNRQVVLFEVVQSVALLLLLRGALALEPLIGSARPLLGFSVLMLGAATFASAVWFGRRRTLSAVNTHFYAALGVVALMTATAILLDAAALAISWGALAVGIAAVAVAGGQQVLVAYGIALAIAAAVPSGLLAHATQALVWGDVAELDVPSWTAIATCVLIASFVTAVARRDATASGTLPRAAAVVASVVSLWAAGGLLAGTLIRWWGSASTTRTVTLSVAACVAAAAGRWQPLAALAWIAYPFLAFVAVKLLAEDLRVDRPLALFVALGVYGAALIVTARLGRPSSLSGR